MENLRISEKKSSSASAVKEKGNLLFLAKDYQSAIAIYREALHKLGPDKTDCRLRSQIISNIGSCQFKLGQYKQALHSFSEAVEVDFTWEKAFLKRSSVLKRLLEKIKIGEQTDEEKEEIARSRSSANIIVDLSQR